ncbi:hypothetical protein ZWY2020_045694 [Hordeum vulgare]|nr:hypothetical protein ZWY2020_045694 [Hordeum vulgare]
MAVALRCAARRLGGSLQLQQTQAPLMPSRFMSSRQLSGEVSTEQARAHFTRRVQQKKEELYDAVSKAEQKKQELFDVLCEEEQAAVVEEGRRLVSSKSENLMIAGKHKIEKEQNNQLRDQISRLLEVEQEQKIKMRERDLTIQSLQKLHEENEKLFDRLTEKSGLGNSPQSENLMIAGKHKIEKEQNNQLRDQISRLLEVEQEQKIKMRERDLTIQSLQAKLKSIESQLNDALNSSDARSTIGSESASVISTPKMMESTAESSSVTKRLEEELAKRDALIEKLHEENEKLFDRLTEKSGLGNSPQASSPSSNQATNAQGRDIDRSNSVKTQSPDVFPATISQDKTGNSGAIVKSSNELAKTTPAGEYLTSAPTAPPSSPRMPSRSNTLAHRTTNHKPNQRKSPSDRGPHLREDAVRSRRLPKKRYMLDILRRRVISFAHAFPPPPPTTTIPPSSPPTGPRDRLPWSRAAVSGLGFGHSRHGAPTPPPRPHRRRRPLGLGHRAMAPSMASSSRRLSAPAPSPVAGDAPAASSSSTIAPPAPGPTAAGSPPHGM